MLRVQKTARKKSVKTQINNHQRGKMMKQLQRGNNNKTSQRSTTSNKQIFFVKVLVILCNVRRKSISSQLKDTRLLQLNT